MLNLTQNYSRGRKRIIMQIKKAMTESTSYLDMNKNDVIQRTYLCF